MLINSFILAISSSIDSLGIGITYGIKNTRISLLGKFFLFFISFFISILAIWFGNAIKTIFPEWLTKFTGGFILIMMGSVICFQALKKENKPTSFLSDEAFIEEKEKVYSFFIRFLGITIKIIKNPISSDFDKSHSIDSKEAIFLAIALSLDSFCIGIGGSFMQVSFILFPFLVSIFQLFFLNIGNFLGQKLHGLGNLPDNIWSVISGILLIFFGISRFIF